MRRASRTHRVDLHRLHDGVRVGCNDRHQIREHDTKNGRHTDQKQFHKRQMNTVDTTVQHYDAHHVDVVNIFFLCRPHVTGYSGHWTRTHKTVMILSLLLDRL